MKMRQRKKIFKIVATKLKSGLEIRPLHQRVIHYEAAQYVDRLYTVEFRPWWYEQDWSEHPLRVEAPRFIRKAEERFGEWSGIDIDLWAAYWQSKLVKVG